VIFPAISQAQDRPAWAAPRPSRSIPFRSFGRNAGSPALSPPLDSRNHGFPDAPAVGALVGNEIVGGGEPLLAPFRPDRAAVTTAERTEAFRNENRSSWRNRQAAVSPICRIFRSPNERLLQMGDK